MIWLKRSFFSIATAIALLVNFTGALVTPAAARMSSRFVILQASEYSRVVELSLHAENVIDYGSFVWLELDEANFENLRASSIRYDEFAGAGEISVPGYQFDPKSQGEPQFRTDVKIDESRRGFHLVQFSGPIKDEWIDQLKITGLDVLQYYPNHAYLVWGSSEQTRRAETLPTVRWSGVYHPAYKINQDLINRSGVISNIDIMFYNDGDMKGTLARLERLGADILQVYPSQPDKTFFNAIVRIDAAAIEAVSLLNTVLWLGYASPEPGLDDEMSDQVLAGNYSGGIPTTGYQAWLNSAGLDGSGVTWAIIDTGVDYDHPDLGSHIVGGYNFTGACSFPGQPGSDCSGGGHGTHVTGIVGGNGAAGFTDPAGFRYGLGVAPAHGIFAMNSLSGANWPPTGGWQEHSKQALLGNAIGGNNSWTTGEGTAHGYQASERTHDLMVRDGNFDTLAVAEPFIEVFSAGNSGPSLSTLTAPKEAKNLIVVASSLNYRAGSIDAISSFSSRGPAVDGRYVPTITAPGEQIASTRNDLGGDCATSISGTNNYYAFCSGTSMASPHASGAVVLISEWWRTTHSGSNPSPAMAKALLVNGAVDMGTADIPNFSEGWGRIHLPNVIDNATSMVYYDQSHLFHNTGDTWTLSVGIADPTKPLKISLAWTDAAGAVGANPALVNNLNLSVTTGGATYLGNRFSAGWSATGGASDSLNNLENVYLQNPSGIATISIQAANLAGDGVPYNGDTTDQDFALVCYNCSEFPDFTLSAAPVFQAVCAPTDATYAIEAGSILGFQDLVTLSTRMAPTSLLTSGFSENPGTPPFSSILTLGNTSQAAPGVYHVDVVGTALTRTHTETVVLSLYNAIPTVPVLQAPGDGASGQTLRPVFSWEPSLQSGTYEIQIATDPTFNTIVDSATGLASNTYTPETDLNYRTSYFWRVRSLNGCGNGAYSMVFSFSTLSAPGDCPLGTLSVTVYSQDFEAGSLGWSHSGIGDSWALVSNRTHSGVNAFRANDPATVSDQRLVSPEIALPAGQSPLTLKFWNYQSLEDKASGCYDGVIVEISTDDGSSWSQLPGSAMLTDPYNGMVDSGFSNPLAGIHAWCGDPQDWLNSVVNLAGYEGQNARFRFRLGSDSSQSREGWYIDDVVVQSCQLDGYSASLGPDSTADGLPGRVITHTFTLQNQGRADTYVLTLDGAAWSTSLTTPSPLSLGAGASASVQVGVQIPLLPTEMLLGSDMFTVSAHSLGEPGSAVTATGTTRRVINPGVQLTPGLQSRAGAPGEVVTHTLTLENTGDYTDTYTLTLEGNTWVTYLPATSSALAPGDAQVIDARVTIPEHLVPDAIIASDVFTVTAASQLEPGTTAHAVRITNANVSPGVQISPLVQTGDGMPGDVITYTFMITNTGDYSDTYDLVLSGNAWNSLAPLSTGWMSSGSGSPVSVRVEIPHLFGRDIHSGTDHFSLDVVSHWDSQVTVRAEVTTTARVDAGLQLLPISAAITGLPGQVITYTFTITNTGNYTDTFNLSADGVWHASLSQTTTGQMLPGASVQAILWVDVPGDAADQSSDITTVQAVSTLDASVTAQVQVTTTAVWRRMFLPVMMK